jgi:hypothetical protein
LGYRRKKSDGAWKVVPILPEAGLPKNQGGVMDPRLRKTLLERLHIPKRIDAAILPGGRFLRTGLATIDRQNRLLYDFSYEWASGLKGNNFAFSQCCLPKITSLRGRVLVLDTRGHGKNYFHSLVEAVPRLFWVNALGYPLSGFDHVLATGPYRHFCSEAFREFGIGPDRLIDGKHFPHVQAEELVVFSDTREFVHRQTVQHLRECFSSEVIESRDSFRRLYITRGPKARRQPLNEAGVASFFEAAGFKVVDLSDLSVAEQRGLFRRAEIVVASHGAALANLVFCRPGTRVLEIFPPRYQKPTYWALSEAADCTISQS